MEHSEKYSGADPDCQQASEVGISKPARAQHRAPPPSLGRAEKVAGQAAASKANRAGKRVGGRGAYLRSSGRWLVHSLVDFGSNIFTFLLMILLLLGTVLGSESGRLWLLQSALPEILAAAGYQLIVDEPATKHLGHWSFRHLTLSKNSDLLLAADSLELSMDLAMLFTGRFAIDRVLADYLRIDVETVKILINELSEADQTDKDSSSFDWQSLQFNDLVPVRVAKLAVKRLHLTLPDENIPEIATAGNLEFAWRGNLIKGQLSLSTLESVPAKLDFNAQLSKKLVGDIELSVVDSETGWLTNRIKLPAKTPLRMDLKAAVTSSDEVWKIQLSRLAMPYQQHSFELTGVIEADKRNSQIRTEGLKLMTDGYPQLIKGRISREVIAIEAELNSLPVNISSFWQDEFRDGSLTGKATVTGTPEFPKAKTRFHLVTTYQQLPIDLQAEATATLEEQKAQIYLHAVNGYLGELSITKGTGLLDFIEQSLDLRVARAETPLAYLRLLDVEPVEDLDVVLKARKVRITGPFVAPSYAGEATAFGSFKKQNFAAAGVLAGDIHGLQASSFELLSGKARLLASGKLNWLQEQLNLTVEAENVPLSLLELLEISVPEQVDALLAAQGTIKGSFQAPQYSGTLRASGSYYEAGDPVSFAINALLQADPTKVTVQESTTILNLEKTALSAKSVTPDKAKNTTLQAKGEVLLAQQTVDASLQFEALPLSVAKFAGITLPYQASGEFDGDLRFKGPINLPMVTGRLGGVGSFAKRPYELTIQGGGKPKDFSLDRAKLSWGEAQLTAEGTYRQGMADFTIDLTDLNLSELSVFGIEALPADLALNLAVFGSPAKPDIRGNIKVKQQLADPDNADSSINLAMAADIELTGDILAMHSQLYQDDTPQGSLELTLPWPEYLSQSQHFSRFISPELPVPASIKGQLNLALIDKLLSQDIHQMAGVVNIDVITSGVLAEPTIYGIIGLENGSYQNRVTRTSLEDGQIKLIFEGQRLEIGSGKASDGGRGRLIAQGFVDWSKQNPGQSGAIDITVTTRNIELLRRDELEGEASGRLAMTGDFKRLLINGDIEVSPLRVVLGILNDSSIPELEIIVLEEAKPPDAELRQFSLPEIDLNVAMRASRQAFIRGRGLNAELEGLVRITGGIDDPDYRGKFAVVRGTFDLFGKRFELAEGDMLFDNQTVSVYIEGRHSDASYEYLVTISGGINDLKIELSTLPDTPQEEAISRLLFGKSVQSITPFQAIRLAQAAQELTGKSSGFDPISSTRDVLQLDNLTVDSATTDSGSGVSVGIGKYINERVYVELQRSADAAQPWQGSIEVELTPKLVLEGSTDEVGGTSVDLKWKYDY